jgi:hypothetical protein
VGGRTTTTTTATLRTCTSRGGSTRRRREEEDTHGATWTNSFRGNFFRGVPHGPPWEGGAAARAALDALHTTRCTRGRAYASFEARRVDTDYEPLAVHAREGQLSVPASVRVRGRGGPCGRHRMPPPDRGWGSANAHAGGGWGTGTEVPTTTTAAAAAAATRASGGRSFSSTASPPADHAPYLPMIFLGLPRGPRLSYRRRHVFLFENDPISYVMSSDALSEEDRSMASSRRWIDTPETTTMTTTRRVPRRRGRGTSTCAGIPSGRAS